MNTRIRFLPLLEVQPGMLLGASVVISERGIMEFTLPAGHVLTEDNLRQIARRRAEYVCVAIPDERSDEEVAEERAKAQERLAHIFRGADRADPMIDGLFQAILRYRGA